MRGMIILGVGGEGGRGEPSEVIEKLGHGEDEGMRAMIIGWYGGMKECQFVVIYEGYSTFGV